MHYSSETSELKHNFQIYRKNVQIYGLNLKLSLKYDTGPFDPTVHSRIIKKTFRIHLHCDKITHYLTCICVRASRSIIAAS